MIINLSLRIRELSKGTPIIEVDQEFNCVRGAMAMANMAYAQQLDFNNRYIEVRGKVLKDYDKAWFDVTA